MADETLYDRIKSGDQTAYPELYRRFAHRIHSYALQLLRDSSAAEDIVQETMTKVYSSLPSLADGNALTGWIFAVARNEIFGQIRRKKPVPLGDDEDLWDEKTPLDSILGQEETEIIQHLLAELKPEYREVLVLREFEGCSYAEIAAITSSTVGAVKSRIFKARKGLLKMIQSQYATRE